jgi:hypothetical protein
MWLSVVLELLCLIPRAAANGLFSSLIADSNVAYKVPIPRRAVWFGGVFVPGAFHTGRASKPIVFFAVDFLSVSFVSVQYMIHPSKYTRYHRYPDYTSFLQYSLMAALLPHMSTWFFNSYDFSAEEDKEHKI